jgi:hypothetical protein
MDISISDEEKLSLSVTKFQEKYSRSVLIDAIESFQWGKGTKQESLEKREELSRTYNSWVNAGADIQHAEAMADSVYQWGFRNRETPKSVTSNLQLFCEFNRCWYLEIGLELPALRNGYVLQMQADLRFMTRVFRPPCER